MNKEKSALEMLHYPIILTMGFGMCFVMSGKLDTQAMQIIGNISLGLIGFTWMLWLLTAFIEIKERVSRK